MRSQADGRRLYPHGKRRRPRRRRRSTCCSFRFPSSASSRRSSPTSPIRQARYLMWLHFSEWLIAAGLAFGALAALVLLVEFFASRAIRTRRLGWAHLVLFYARPRRRAVQCVRPHHRRLDGGGADRNDRCRSSARCSRSPRSATLFRVPVTWVARRGRRGHEARAPLAARRLPRARRPAAAATRTSTSRPSTGPTRTCPSRRAGCCRTCSVPKVVGWSQGETPTVPQGFRIEAIATGLSNPRNVYPLPNGDLLVDRIEEGCQGAGRAAQAPGHGLDRSQGARRQRRRPEQPHPAAARRQRRRQARGADACSSTI